MELFFIRICLYEVKNLEAKAPASDFKQPSQIGRKDKVVQPVTWASSGTEDDAGPYACYVQICSPKPTQAVSPVGMNLYREPHTLPSLPERGVVL